MLEFLSRVTMRPKLVAALRRFLTGDLRQYIREQYAEQCVEDPKLAEAIFMESALSQLHEMRNEEMDAVLGSEEYRQFMRTVLDDTPYTGVNVYKCLWVFTLRPQP